MGVLAIVVGSLFAALFARMWYLQVLSADESRLAAEANAVRTVVEPAPRGRILDRNGVVLVDNRASNVVAIDTAALGADERPAVLARLAPVVGAPVEELVERLADPAASPLLPVPVAEDVSDEVLIRLRERQDELPGVVARRVAVRAFPQGDLAAHLLGYVGEISPEQLTELEGLGYEPGDVVGKAGVELAYDRDLRGRDGTISVEVDAAGKPLRVVDTDVPEPGHDVVLSIDAEVQRVAERGLAQGLEAARGRRFSDDDAPLVADAGAAVVLDAKEGSVLALASYPTFDPAIFDDGLSQAEFDALNDPSAGVPQLNRAIQASTHRVRPGSPSRPPLRCGPGSSPPRPRSTTAAPTGSPGAGASARGATRVAPPTAGSTCGPRWRSRATCSSTASATTSGLAGTRSVPPRCRRWPPSSVWASGPASRSSASVAAACPRPPRELPGTRRTPSPSRRAAGSSATTSTSPSDRARSR
jgi:penicillin-binding protein 2